MELAYDKDTREACKYGADCYQKNPAHHKRFKHPKKRPSEELKLPVKRFKESNEDTDEKRREKDEPVEATSRECKTPEAPLDNTAVNYSDVPEDYKKEIIIDSLEPDIGTRVKTVFGVEMPADFYDFYSFCESISKTSPESALSDAGIHLVGPYDLFSGKIKKCTRTEAVLHYRYFYDPPEFQTVLKSEKFHVGYFRDDPNELPTFLGSIDSTTSCTISPLADNIFAATNIILENSLQTTNPFLKVKINKLKKALQAWAKNVGSELEKPDQAIKARKRKIVAKTFHGAGIVVPYVKSTDIGYRNLIEDKELKKLLQDIVKDLPEKSPFSKQLDKVVNFSNLANDECDFGAGLELGINLFCFGHKTFHGHVLHLLKTSYTLLDRQLYSTIVKIHLNNRREGPNVQAIV